MPTMEDALKNALENALKQAYDLDADVIHIEQPKDKQNGDFSTNLAMTLAKTLRNNPFVIAETIKEKLELPSGVDRVEVARPGFINFFVSEDYLSDIIPEILEKGEQFGASDIGKGTHVNIEFVSVNPTGSMHVGHARGAAAGDSMARVMKKAGFDVTKEFYVNDGGNQIHNLALSINVRYHELFGRTLEMPEDAYHGPEITELAETIKAEHGDRYLYEDGYTYFREYGVKYLLDGIKNDLAAFDVEFDVFFSEKSLYDNGEVANTLKFLKENGHTYEKDDALFLNTTDYGDEKDRVIVKRDGTYTYLLPDIAYHKNKLSRGFDKLIDILGGDHHGYIPRLKAAIQMVGGKADTLEVDILQIVKVLREGKEVKMSKRSGKAISLRDLVDDVGKDAVRYFFSRHSLNTHMDLDLDLAIKKTNENPVFYAQYAHARINSLFEKAAEQGYEPDASIQTYQALTNEQAKDIMKLLMNYPSLIEEAATKRIPHKITNYVHTLASALHSFYSAVPILKGEATHIREHLNLLEATRIVLKDALFLIGVNAPRSM